MLSTRWVVALLESSWSFEERYRPQKLSMSVTVTAALLPEISVHVAWMPEEWFTVKVLLPMNGSSQMKSTSPASELKKAWPWVPVAKPSDSLSQCARLRRGIRSGGRDPLRLTIRHGRDQCPFGLDRDRR